MSNSFLGHERTKRIVKLLSEGHTPASVARKEGVSEQWVYRVARKYLKAKRPKNDNGLFIAGNDRIQNKRVGGLLDRITTKSKADSRMKALDALLPLETVLTDFVSLTPSQKLKYARRMAEHSKVLLLEMESTILERIGQL